jgi:hypothetical protein
MIRTTHYRLEPPVRRVFTTPAQPIVINTTALKHFCWKNKNEKYDNPAVYQ